MPPPPARPPARPPSRSNVPRHAAPARFPFRVVVLVLVLIVGVVVAAKAITGGGDHGGPKADPTTQGSSSNGGTTNGNGDGNGNGKSTGPDPTGSTTGADPSPSETEDDPDTPGPLNTKFPGLVTFRGNATRNYYGEGPLPTHPEILWQYPQTGGLCSTSDGGQGPKTWCGTGWTGQPNVIVHDNGKIEIREGAYDAHYHFWNGKTGQVMHPDFVTGDLAKGSASSDADGYPLYYAGSRDNNFRVIATDRPKPTELWSVNADTSVSNPVWNNDWDGAALQLGDYLLEGSENSWFYVIKLNRSYDSKDMVQVDPKIVMLVPGFTQEFLNDLGDDSVSIENSVAFFDGVVYFGNSGGLVQGWDISDILDGGSHYEKVFEYWVGDETDASIVIDQEGDLYVGRHYSFNIPNRSRARDEQVGGSLIKLDPSRKKNPVVWTVEMGGTGPDGGLLGTVALYKGVVWAPGSDGHLLAVDAKSGKVLSDTYVAPPLNGSPVTIDDQLVIGDCSGDLHDYDISNPRNPQELWTVHLEGCIESTPAAYKGMLWVGARGGKFYGIGDPK